MQVTKEFIKALCTIKSASSGTSLITMYIPPNYQMNLVTSKLSSELSTASNIKDKTVKKSTIYALKSALEAIKTSKYNTSPSNGLVLCAGEPMYCL